MRWISPCQLFIVQKNPTQPPEQHAALHYETNQALLAQMAMPFLRQKRKTLDYLTK
jgi:hypothetical protein